MIRISLDRKNRLVSVSAGCSHKSLPPETLAVAKVLYEKRLLTCESFVSHVLNKASNADNHDYEPGYSEPESHSEAIRLWQNHENQVFYESHGLERFVEIVDRIQGSQSSRYKPYVEKRVPFPNEFFLPKKTDLRDELPVNIGALMGLEDLYIEPADPPIGDDGIARICVDSYTHSSHNALATYHGKGVFKVHKASLEYQSHKQLWNYQSRYRGGKYEKLCGVCNRWYVSIGQHVRSKLHALNFESAFLEVLTQIGDRFTQAQRVRDALKRPNDEETDDATNTEA